MRYIPARNEDIRTMMQEIGIESFSQLFSMIPSEYLYKGEFQFPKSLSEQELTSHLWKVSSENHHSFDYSSFLGGGAYNHYVPALVDALIGRGEFMTSYTPYQPEISQGTLQAIFEFQTLICQLTGLDIANASMYDGASSAAETVLMAKRIHANRKKVLLPLTVHPIYRKVIRTYTRNLPIEIVDIPYDAEGRTDFDALAGRLSDDVICLVVQSPNYFGVIEKQKELFDKAKESGAVSIALVAEALSMGILKPPAMCGADIAAGECQSLGLPVAYGGPYAGFLATTQKFLRTMPGRLIGMARDKQGRRGFVLTLAAREQHIRREKATSNICTNQGLCALAVTVYLSFVGSEGLRKLALRNLQICDYAKKALQQPLRFSTPSFNEFVIDLKEDAEDVARKLSEKKILPGIPLGRYYPELKNCLLVCVTEMTKKEDIHRLASELEGTR